MQDLMVRVARAVACWGYAAIAVALVVAWTVIR
jgi:hypothetical protein